MAPTWAGPGLLRDIVESRMFGANVWQRLLIAICADVLEKFFS